MPTIPSSSSSSSPIDHHKASIKKNRLHLSIEGSDKKSLEKAEMLKKGIALVSKESFQALHDVNVSFGYKFLEFFGFRRKWGVIQVKTDEGNRFVAVNLNSLKKRTGIPKETIQQAIAEAKAAAKALGKNEKEAIYDLTQALENELLASQPQQSQVQREQRSQRQPQARPQQQQQQQQPQQPLQAANIGSVAAHPPEGMQHPSYYDLLGIKIECVSRRPTRDKPIEIPYFGQPLKIWWSGQHNSFIVQDSFNFSHHPDRNKIQVTFDDTNDTIKIECFNIEKPSHEYMPWLQAITASFPSSAQAQAAAAAAAPEPAMPQLQGAQMPKVALEDLLAKAASKDRFQPSGLENRISMLAKDPVKAKELVEHANATRPILHAKVLPLITDFLAHKRVYGTPVEQALYQNMTPQEFIDRLLTKRPLAFLTSADSYTLRDGSEGEGGFEKIGTSEEFPPLVLKDYISYDEMAISALLGVSVPTHIINDGDRHNFGRVGAEGSYEEKGVYVGAVGARFERPELMEWKHMIITRKQNTFENGYGLDRKPEDMNTEKAKSLAMWTKAYGKPFPTFEEAQQAADAGSLRYIKINSNEYLDAEVYKARMRMVIEPFLFDANERGKAAGKKAYVTAVGLGLGVWMKDKKQAQLQANVYREILNDYAFPFISDIDFSYFPDGTTCGGITDNQKIKKDGHEITIHFSLRNPAAKLPPGKLAVAQYAWDGNAAAGNEYWKGDLNASGDPAAACCSTISELQDPEVNPNVSAARMWAVDPSNPTPPQAVQAAAAQAAQAPGQALAPAALTQPQIIAIAKLLKSHPSGNPFEFKIGGKEYCAWKGALANSFSIHLKATRGNKDPTTQKSILINGSKNPIVITVDGKKLEDPAQIPQEKNGWLQALYALTPESIKAEVVSSLDDAEKVLRSAEFSLENLPAFRNYLQERHGNFADGLLLQNPQCRFWYDQGQNKIILSLGSLRGIAVAFDKSGNAVFHKIKWNDPSKPGNFQVVLPHEDVKKPALSCLQLAFAECKNEVEKKIEDYASLRSLKEGLGNAEHTVFKTALSKVKKEKPVVIADNGISYKIWFTPGKNNAKGAFNIQAASSFARDAAEDPLVTKGTQTDKLGINIDANGNVESVYLNGKPIPEPYQKVVPARFLRPFYAGYQKALQQFLTDYNPGGKLEISTVGKGVTDIAAHHIDLLTKNIYQMQLAGKPNPILSVAFAEPDGTFEPGIDAGGLSRQFLNDIFLGLTKNSILRFNETEGGLYIPRTKQNYEQGKPGPKLTEEETKLFRNMGNLLMFCYQSKGANTTYLTGQHLDPSIIAAALKIDSNNVHADVITWEPETLLEVCKTLAEGQGLYDHAVKLAHDTLKNDSLKTQEEALEIATKLLAFEEILGLDEILPEKFKNGDGTINPAKINAEDIRDLLWHILRSNFQEQLEPVQAIAYGMKQGVSGADKNIAWNTFVRENQSAAKAAAVNAKMQGNLDRNVIANAITIQEATPAIEQRVRWLKKWITAAPPPEGNGATEKELRDFLKLATGSSSLASGALITVQKQNPHKRASEAPYTHTCFNMIDLNPEWAPHVKAEEREEFFLESLKAALVTAGEFGQV